MVPAVGLERGAAGKARPPAGRTAQTPGADRPPIRRGRPGADGLTRMDAAVLNSMFFFHRPLEGGRRFDGQPNRVLRCDLEQGHCRGVLLTWCNAHATLC